MNNFISRVNELMFCFLSTCFILGKNVLAMQLCLPESARQPFHHWIKKQLNYSTRTFGKFRSQ